MKKPLPQSTTKAVALFPRNLRLITEYSFTQAQSHNIKVILVSIFSLFLIGLIFLQGVSLWYSIQEKEVFAQQRVQLQQEVQAWQQVANKYKGYRDVYYRIASIQYKLGNVASAQSYVKKALQLDPNYPEGQVLGAKIGL